MDRLSDILPKVLASRGLKLQGNASHLVHAAELWILKHMGLPQDVIVVRKFAQGVLILEAYDAVSLADASASKESLKAFLQAEFPLLNLRDVRLQRARSSSGKER